jgi:protein regulator of cytokinesis 1
MEKYEIELERCLELRRSSLSSFIIAVRAEIDSMWTELMLSDEEKGDFGAYINGKLLRTSALLGKADE